MLTCDLFRTSKNRFIDEPIRNENKANPVLKTPVFFPCDRCVCVLNPRELSYSLHRHVRNIINSPTYLDRRCIFHWFFSSRGTITREKHRVFRIFMLRLLTPPRPWGGGGEIFRPSACVSGRLNIEAPIFNRATSILRLFLNIEVVFSIRQPQY